VDDVLMILCGYQDEIGDDGLSSVMEMSIQSKVDSMYR